MITQGDDDDDESDGSTEADEDNDYHSVDIVVDSNIMII